MHREAYQWIGETLKMLPAPSRVIEIGSRDINGSPRPLLPGVAYLGVDLAPGKGVDVVADGATYAPDAPADIVLCAEVLEHTEAAAGVVLNAVACTKPGGYLLITCATDPRAPHSAVDGGVLQAGEYYRNVPPDDLEEWVKAAGAIPLVVDVAPSRGDLYVLAQVSA